MSADLLGGVSFVIYSEGSDGCRQSKTVLEHLR